MNSAAWLAEQKYSFTVSFSIVQLFSSSGAYFATISASSFILKFRFLVTFQFFFLPCFQLLSYSPEVPG